MGYDISLEHGTLSKDLGNYTYNCSAMFVAGCDNSLSDLHGMRCAVAAPIIRHAVDWMVSHPDECRAMNPSNGWGKYETFLPWVQNILAECEANPDATLHVC